MAASISLYKLGQKGTLFNAGDSTNPDKLVQIGEDISQGFEVDVIGQIYSNLSLVMNYAFNESEITQSKNLFDIGRQKPNAPKHIGNVWSKYSFSSGQLKGLGFGIGANFQTKFLGSIVPAGQQPTVFTSYEIFNSAIYYTIDKFKIQLNFNNITNKTHWVGVCSK